MAKFTKKENVNVNAYVEVDVEVDINVEEFYERMSILEENEMLDLLRNNDVNIPNLMDSVDDKAKFYKDFAYHVGVSDTEHLENLTQELQYWSKK